MDEDVAEILEMLEAKATDMVRAAFHEEAWIREYLIDMGEDELGDEYGALVREHVARIVPAALEAHAEAQSTWPAITDCDRLTTAFAALDVVGVLARENLPCCQTCAGGEMIDHIAEARQAGRDVRGYAFYHEQDVEGAVENGSLYIAYGRAEPNGDLEADAAFGEEVRGALEAEGLEVVWDGSADRRLGVALDWKKRSAPAKAAAEPWWRRLFGGASG